jgi:hypothetical protein
MINYRIGEHDEEKLDPDTLMRLRKVCQSAIQTYERVVSIDEEEEKERVKRYSERFLRQ